MSQGLKKHWHQYYIEDVRYYYNKQKHCKVKKITYSCMICNKSFDRYIYLHKHKKDRKCKTLHNF